MHMALARGNVIAVAVVCQTHLRGLSVRFGSTPRGQFSAGPTFALAARSPGIGKRSEFVRVVRERAPALILINAEPLLFAKALNSIKCGGRGVRTSLMS